MLIALLIAFLLGGHSGSAPFLDLVHQLEVASRHAVIEPDRRQAVVVVLKEIKGAIKRQEQDQAHAAKALLMVGANHAATQADQLLILDAQGRTTAAFQARMISLHRELKTLLKPGEWAAMVAKSAIAPLGS